MPNLSVPEIAPELYLSKNTVKTHISLLYDKLGVHRRWEAVERAAPSDSSPRPPVRPNGFPIPAEAGYSYVFAWKIDVPLASGEVMGGPRRAACDNDGHG